MLVEKNLVFYDAPLTNQNDLFDFMADQLMERNYVKEGFRDAIKNREEKYPTGLKLDGLNLAISHVEKEYANAQKLVVIMPEKPIIFKNIETFDPLEVNLVFGIILNNSNEHLEILKNISQMFQEKEMINKINNIDSKEQLSILMQGYFNS
ncbi:MAG TPA: PTS sugar transporter subunit IIA [Pseudogracilibacillus sp.]|nr:PTS sugar transporter subunit IIA [Pseudogracilibacillus sp.]